MLKVEEIGFDDQVEFKMEGIVKDIEYEGFGIEIEGHEGQRNWIFVGLEDIISIKKNANKKCYIQQEPNLEICRVVDAAGNTPVILAAQKQDWDKVRTMLKWGADARHWNCFGINALYYALIYGQLALAIELYDAGARLDGLNSDLPDEGSGNRILKLAAELQRTGRNIFFDERNTLVDCCRKGAYLQARDKIRSASREELTEAISELIRNGRYKPEENFSLLCEMYSIGGSIDSDLLETYAGTKGPKRPDAMKNPESYTEMIRDLLRNTVTDPEPENP